MSNFSVPQIERILLNCKIKPSNIQLECHAYYQQRKIKQYCDLKSITLSAYGPLGSPDRPEHHRLEKHTVLLDEQVIRHIASDYRKTPAQRLLRFLIQNGFAVLPKSQNYNRMKENITCLILIYQPWIWEKYKDLIKV
ncbi:hypothetical protein KUTeg_012516 [Tegillarca granosa]|uniref:NADP-dependent oxidoreductase domain-containing protein n=1 Tax=Tegillarca granosa TaxID=220873 RepID=A0ABQ9F276_TEGGR|nr:hypothetical protein KUTeg_012516 [Tegillarca granosa]